MKSTVAVATVLTVLGAAAAGCGAPGVPAAPSQAARPVLAASGSDGPRPAEQPRSGQPSRGSPAGGGSTAVPPPARTARVTVGEVVLDVEVADTPYRQVRGLSDRDVLAPRSGMMFSFGVPTTSGFYMFRTRMPLSIMFVDRDRVVDVTEMTPCLTDLPTDCPVYDPAAPYTFAVEAAGGTFTAAGVVSGDVVSVAG